MTMSSISSSRKLKGGVEMPYLGLGTFLANDETVKAAVLTALDTGYRAIDTACSYKNEAPIGEALHEAFASGKYKREEVFITTKLNMAFMGSEENIRKTFNESLKKLQLDYIDLYLIHAPFGYQLNEAEDHFPRGADGKLLYAHHDIVKVWKVLEDLVAEGKTRTIGVSNFNSKQISRILEIAKVPIATNQVECHAYFMQNKLRQFCTEKGISVTAYAPMASPGFTGKKCEENSLPVLINDPVVNEIAAEHKKKPSQVLLRYLLDQDIIIIPKSTNPGRIAENADIFNFQLSNSNQESLAKLDKNLRLFDFVAIAEGHPEFPFAEPF